MLSNSSLYRPVTLTCPRLHAWTLPCSLKYHRYMNRTRLALSLILLSVWLGMAGSPAHAAQLVALTPEEERYSDVFSNPPVVAAQPGGSYVIAWDDDTFSRIG